ncbi:Fcf2-domain-containing protein [Metschnikowia bicuspidata var. bicuspidata NRRL YB-4993]|uniref:Fcf2-domain-containing protein n=1 Tax=Metschnikowia bicuspidata var. bicuspidata NRRL YB-4993 TaxID=869754 RepID=A0A1A0H8H7_9ASCO|nr:Fcf2-domain-containing protein [Metschnikowia bicuspidata var. bicuspidata NRRL YB-4993]OBA20326.1 Fcf2-domain-containing protein [Metschnikowia bicuspidata var. bicuspidata NRRL YB-4993]
MVPDLAETSLDQLFQALAQETKPVVDDEMSEFDKIQRQIEQLPKIESGLEASMQKAVDQKPLRSFAVKIDDPVTRARKVKKEEKTDSGDDWFNMKKPEITPEIKRDLLILKNRSALDPKRHYKKEKWQVPKFFQTGTIIEGNTEFYSARISRKNRGKTLAAEILNDSTTTEYFKRKYTEIQKVNKSGGKSHYNKLKSKRRGY